MPLQIRRGTTAEREAITPLAGELVYDTTLGAVYVGDGTTAGGLGVTAFTTEQAQDAVASLISAGTHTGITFTYNDVLGTLSATVEGAARLDINGSVYGDDSTPLVDSILNSFNLDGTIRSHVIPYADSVYDLGDATHKFRDLYLSGSSINLGDATITSTGTAVNLPTGSTVGGVVIGTGSGSGDGVIDGSNYNINIIGDDSSIIVNSATGEIIGDTIGNHYGDVTGSVFSDSSSMMLDGTAGLVVCDVLNDVVTTDRVLASTTTLSGLDSGGVSPGLIVISEVSEDTGPTIDIRTHLSSPDGQSFVASRSRGTLASPAAVQQDDAIFKFLFFGADADGVNAFAGSIAVVADGTPTSGIVPGRFDIYTSDSSGSIALGLSIDSSQIIRVADNTVAANSGSGTADVTGGVLTYLRINVDGTEYAMPLYGLVP